MNASRQMVAVAFAMASILLGALGAVAGPPAKDPTRVNNRSPVFLLAPESVSYYGNHTAWVVTNTATGEGIRELTATIEPKIIDMIDHAEQYLVLSFFLFDNFYADEAGDRDVVTQITDHIIARKQQRPRLSVALILDPSNRAYSNRVSPAEKRLRAHGVDVFYSDLISGLDRGTFLGVREGLGHLGRVLNAITFGGVGKIGSAAGSSVPLPVGDFDGKRPNVEMIYNAALVKANHRKLVVADVAGGELEVLVSSANPHNASAYHINNAVALRGGTGRLRLQPVAGRHAA